ncbi:CHAT domain-containing protein [Suillus occidentalis]|nr:CHAT domain-containing protein [Suillus occidentalis]
MLRINRLFRSTNTRDSFASQYIRLEIISAKNLQVPSKRIPAGIYIYINIDSRRHWRSAIKDLSSDKSVVWGDTVTLSSHASAVFTVEIRASYEVDRMLGSGELIGKLKISWGKLLDTGDEPFVLSFPSVCDVHPSLTLKTTIVNACDDQDSALSYSLIDSEISRDTDKGHARFAKYVIGEMPFHLERAVEYFQPVLDQCPVDHPDRAGALTNLAYARLECYIQGYLQDIETTTSLFREALALRPQGHPDHALSLYNLITALKSHYKRELITVYIHESAELCCKLLPICPEGSYLRSNGVDNVVEYVFGEYSDLPIDISDENINLRRNVLELCPVGHQLRPWALKLLALAMNTRFKQRGNADDIDETIQLRREVVSLCPEGHRFHIDNLNSLASSLLVRFRHQGKPNDLNEAISLHEEALHLRPVGHEYRDSSLGNLGHALLTRFYSRGDSDSIAQAINLYREALALRPRRHPGRAIMLSNLALALNTKYDKFHVIKDLNEAIDRYRQSLRIKRHDHLADGNFGKLSVALCSRFKHTRKNQDIEEAIDLCHRSLAALSSLHPNIFFTYSWLRVAYLSRYEVQLNPADLSLAVEYFRLASRHPTQGLPDRIGLTYTWTTAMEQHGHQSALEAYSTFFELLGAHLATRSSSTSRREAAAAIRYSITLPVDAASCAIRWDNLRHAVELVEQGRGQQWSLASRLKTPVEDLESAHPKLAHNYLELSRRISDASQDSAPVTDRAAADRATTEYRKLTEQWEAAVAEIRNLRAFSRFLLPPSYADLQAATRHGPIIILIASKYSCNAIVVPTSGEPRHIPLSSVTLKDLNILKDRFARAIRHASTMNPKAPRNDLIVLLRTVWDEIMLPIVNVLQHDLKLKFYSRIWLCPTAAFTSIPLHAAHPFRTNADRSKEPCLEDLYICSYTPTLSALIRSRQMMKKCVSSSFVAIGQGQPGAGKGKALLAVDSELELVHKRVPETATRTIISGEAATRAGALEALQENTWVHLACHGKQDPTQPYNSHFVMRDEHLTLLDIMNRDIPHAEFAFLSACHTAVGDKEMPDEVVHLAAGLQFSGFKSVVGTLWEVNDSVARHVVEAFYTNMFNDSKDDGVMDCTKAAWALNRATRSVKTKVPLEQRMVFIHIGV